MILAKNDDSNFLKYIVVVFKLALLKALNPWSPGGSFMVIKMIITSTIPVF